MLNRVPRSTPMSTEGYDNLAAYEHGHVRHSAGEYVGANDIHANNVESMWALLKRGLCGTLAPRIEKAPGALRKRGHLPIERGHREGSYPATGSAMRS